MNAVAVSEPLFVDDFDAGTSAAAWSAQLSGTDASVDYAFDYSSLGIPAAPNSAGGTTVGMRFLVNQAANLSQGISASPLGVETNGDFRLQFDGWLNYVGPLGGWLPESKQVATFGIGSAGLDTKWPATPGNGVALFGCSTTGEGSDNFLAFVNGMEALPASFMAGSPDGDAGYHQALFPAQQAPVDQMNAYASQGGSTQPGETAFVWHRFEVTRTGNTVTWSIDGQQIATVDVLPGSLAGNGIFLGFADMDPTSSLDPNNFLNAFIVDNVRIDPIVDERPVVDSIALDLRTAGKVDTGSPEGAGIFGGGVMAGDLNDFAQGNNVPVTVVSSWGFDSTSNVGELRLEADLTVWNSDNTIVDPQGFRFRFTVHVEGESSKPGAPGFLNGAFNGLLGIDEPVQGAPDDYPTIEEGEALVFSVRDLEVLQAPPGRALRFGSISDPQLWNPQDSPLVSDPAPDTLRFEWSDADPGDSVLGTAGPGGFIFNFEVVEETSDATVAVAAEQIVLETSQNVALENFVFHVPGGLGVAPTDFEVATDTPEFFALPPDVSPTGTLSFQAAAPGSGNLRIRALDDAGFTPWKDVALHVKAVDVQAVLPLDPFLFESQGNLALGSGDMVTINTDIGTIRDAESNSLVMASRGLLLDMTGRIWRVFCVDSFSFAAGSSVAFEGADGHGFALVSRGGGSVGTTIKMGGIRGADGADVHGDAVAEDGGDGTDGGAMAFVTNVTLTISGALRVDGGDGGEGGLAYMDEANKLGSPGNGGDGGSAGYLLVSAPNLSLSGSLSARGGEGGDSGVQMALGGTGADGGLGGDGGTIVIANNYVNSGNVSVGRGAGGLGNGSAASGQDGVASYPPGVSYLGAVADFRRGYGLASDGSDDTADWSGNGIPNLFYHVFALGDPHQVEVDRSRMPSVRRVEGGVEFSYVVPDDPGNLWINPQVSTDLSSFVPIATLPPEERESSSITSVVEGIYVRRTLTFPAAPRGRFFRIGVSDDSFEAP
ncbi:hypothetical protein [Luteolibacter marinus]|uniref:hypothetical protein n=1 Tax=Luteolibacter marinus TaxID=2776705 RepID=UPI001866A47E|nr:hypothetical protein [Luteolibacter marinus]